MGQALHRDGRHDEQHSGQHDRSVAEVAGRHAEQLGLYEGLGLRARVTTGRQVRSTSSQPLCAGCRAREARYGFRPEGLEVASFDRPRTLCFDCFRVELTRRQQVRERMARGWNAHQVGLPLDQTLRALDKRRRRAQIAARHALDA